jgi:hypothetical protein
VDERVRSSVGREEIGPERDIASKLETMLHAELSGTAECLVLEPSASKPDQSEPTGMFRLKSCESFGEKQWILLGLQSADREERDLSSPVTRRRGGHDVFGAHERDGNRCGPHAQTASTLLRPRHIRAIVPKDARDLRQLPEARVVGKGDELGLCGQHHLSER